MEELEIRKVNQRGTFSTALPTELIPRSLRSRSLGKTLGVAVRDSGQPLHQALGLELEVGLAVGAVELAALERAPSLGGGVHVGGGGHGDQCVTFCRMPERMTRAEEKQVEE